MPNSIGTNQVDPVLPSLGVAQLVGAVVVAWVARNLLGFHMTAGPDGAKRPVVGVDHDRMPGLVRGALVEISHEWLWIGTGINRSPDHPSHLPKRRHRYVPQELPNSSHGKHMRGAPDSQDGSGSLAEVLRNNWRSRHTGEPWERPAS